MGTHSEMARGVSPSWALLALLVVSVHVHCSVSVEELADLSAVEELVALGGDVAEHANSQIVGDKSRCDDSQRARSQVCRLYGQSSNSCKSVSAAVTSSASRWGCSDDIIGEEWGNALSGGKSLQDCKDFNKDQVPSSICKQAKLLCNVPNKDYCTHSLHFDCFASIGKGCPGTPDMTHASYTPPPFPHPAKATPQANATAPPGGQA